MKKFLFILALLASISCSKETQIPVSDLKPGGQTSTVIPLSEALASLDEKLSELYSVTKSNSCKQYELENITTIGATGLPSTKAAELQIPDTLMYLVNFNSNKGFAILAGDRRLGEDVYCIAEEGSVAPADFKRAFEFLSSSVSETKSSDINEELFHDMGPDFVPALLLSAMLNDLQDDSIKQPHEKTKAIHATDSLILLNTKWGQWGVFNDCIPKDKKNRECPVGCVATACGQIMAYCRYPENPVFDGLACSWDKILEVSNYKTLNKTPSSEAATQVAKFMYHIGKKHLLYIRYAYDGSWGMADGVVRTLKAYGYKNVKKVTGFGQKNRSKASASLRNRYPVYLGASDSKRCIGHAWVIDGEWNGYFHCNWGWSGKWDGYYSKDNCFVVGNRVTIDKKDPWTEEQNFRNNKYDWNFRMVTYTL